MGNKTYLLRYLPIFYSDLSEKILYISKVLHNPDAANRLLDSVDSAIMKRLPMAESFEPFISLKERNHPYYRIIVGNFIIYYVVIDEGNGTKIMEVRRFLYKRQNTKNFI